MFSRATIRLGIGPHSSCIKWCPARLGVGPILFLIYINDLDCGLINSILKFADDTKIYETVSTRTNRRYCRMIWTSYGLVLMNGKCYLTWRNLKSSQQCLQAYNKANCKAVTGLATFSARIVIYLMLIRHAGT